MTSASGNWFATGTDQDLSWKHMTVMLFMKCKTDYTLAYKKISTVNYQIHLEMEIISPWKPTNFGGSNLETATQVLCDNGWCISSLPKHLWWEKCSDGVVFLAVQLKLWLNVPQVACVVNIDKMVYIYRYWWWWWWWRRRWWRWSIDDRWSTPKGNLASNSCFSDSTLSVLASMMG